MVLHVLLKNGTIILPQHLTIAIAVAVFPEIVEYVSFIVLLSVLTIDVKSATSLHKFV